MTAIDRDILDDQARHWQTTFSANPNMYGTDPSDPARYAIDRFTRESAGHVLELGAGQGRDTLALLRAGLTVTALDYAPAALADLDHNALAAGYAARLTTVTHDARRPLPLSAASVDGCYSHMLFCMALTTAELHGLTRELRRVVRPGGLVIYTARSTLDAHYGAGTARGDQMYEHGGFIVHFFDRTLIDRLAAGFELLDVSEFTEGALPRHLARVTMRVPAGLADP